MAKVVRPVRYAIYTRKSTEEGLPQEFTSLDAQREAGRSYIKSQASQGWKCLVSRYDDGGFTGGNLERPALTRLLADIQKPARSIASWASGEEDKRGGSCSHRGIAPESAGKRIC